MSRAWGHVAGWLAVGSVAPDCRQVVHAALHVRMLSVCAGRIVPMATTSERVVADAMTPRALPLRTVHDRSGRCGTPPHRRTGHRRTCTVRVASDRAARMARAWLRASVRMGPSTRGCRSTPVPTK